ncbi:MAG TPA: V-type ATP synthase subunit E [Spirochaetia bacterium]|jgi:V/A-type H+-transporting ATPase subunit E|nr:V-type ATP synthase subunit E [Spirochaetia bacterium]
MDVQLKELIETIKQEGVQSAEETSRKIIAEAEEKAKTIVANAERQAQSIIKQANDDAERTRKASEEAIKQAGRDLILKVSAQIRQMFKTLLEAETEKALSSKFLEEAVIALLSRFHPSELERIAVELPPDKFESLKDGLNARFAEEMKKGMEIKPFPGLRSGFRVSMKDGTAYYDFSERGIAEMLGELLNPELASILKNAATMGA